VAYAVLGVEICARRTHRRAPDGAEARWYSRDDGLSRLREHGFSATRPGRRSSGAGEAQPRVQNYAGTVRRSDRARSGARRQDGGDARRGLAFRRSRAADAGHRRRADGTDLSRAMILKLKRTPGIYVVGFMAAGKTTIGRLLADELGWGFADIDEDIETSEGMKIADIFDQRGEEEFR